MPIPFRAALHMLPLAALLAALAGCGDRVRQEQLDLARQNVQTALESWQAGEKPEALLQRPVPIEFHDDDRQMGARLDNFEIVRTFAEEDAIARCAVILHVDRRGGAVKRQEVTYQVKLKPTVVVARDPFY